MSQNSHSDVAGMEYSLGCTADRAANNSDQMITDRCLNNPANELQPNDIKMSEPSPQRKEDQMETQGNITHVDIL